MPAPLAAVPAVPGSAPVPGRLVRKHLNDEVLITDWHPVSGTTHRVTAHWPQRHDFYAPHVDRYSPLLLIETIRQALAMLSNTAFEVPLEYRLGWDYCSSTITPAMLGIRPEDSGAAVELTITHTVPTKRRRGGPVRLEAEISAFREGELLGTAHLRYTCHPPALYDRLRGRHADAKTATSLAPPPGTPVPPGQVGRTTERDVVLCPTDQPRRWQLRVDTGHSVLFDHAHDHLPGMVLLEAASQAVQYLAGPERTNPVTLRTHFTRYTELDAPCWIEATPLERPEPGLVSSDITGTQNGHVTFTTQVVARLST
ncbi:ScbA/BarX family gamma-butyrolactone biosynthesis protein [Streptomyces sp. NPDC057743]|uniref:ScbA/BarX family gamma-butyrolactone biosynthesis protein n=1 Tax=Streptomyces sp. NPDC057743 TaxID=3346236 RepID=UPI0036A6D90B